VETLVRDVGDWHRGVTDWPWRDNASIRHNALERYPTRYWRCLPSRIAGGERVLSKMDRESPQCVRRIIEVDYALVSGHAIGCRIELRVDRVACVLHPIFRAGTAGSRARTSRD
jgi:hypothetical protein